VELMPIVDEGQTVQHTHGNVPERFFVIAPAGIYNVLQRASVHELHDDGHRGVVGRNKGVVETHHERAWDGSRSS